MRLDSNWTTALYKSFTYFLTYLLQSHSHPQSTSTYVTGESLSRGVNIWDSSVGVRSAAATQSMRPKTNFMGKNICDTVPAYLSDPYVPATAISGRQHLRSAATGTLLVPRARTATGQRSFAVNGPLQPHGTVFHQHYGHRTCRRARAPSSGH